MYLLFSFEFFYNLYCANVDVKKGKEKIYSESECVVLNFL